MQSSSQCRSNKSGRASQRQRIAARVAGVTCSSSWTRHVSILAEAAGMDASKAGFNKSLRERGIYPPRPESRPDGLPRHHAVRMKRCDACGRIVPPNNLAQHNYVRVCDDCRIEPTTDLDHWQEDSSDPSPATHLHAMVKATDDGQSPRERAREKLLKLGLNNQEVLVLAFLLDGYSQRRISRFMRCTPAVTQQLRRSAEARLNQRNLPIPTASS